MTDAPRIRCHRDDDPRRALEAAFAVRDAGDVPLIGDARWADAHWERLRARFDGLETPADAAWATFTSGTTGSPRVVLRSAASWSTSFDEITRLLSLSAADVVALPVTVVSSMTMFQAAHAQHVGASIELPRRGRLDDDQLARATIVHATPLIVRDLVARIEAGAASRLRLAFVGGDALPGGLVDRADALGVRIVSYVGAAELSFVAVDVGDDTGVGPATRGRSPRALRPLPGVDVRIGDDDELWVRSPYVALGYAGDDGGPLRRSGDGWVTVGDRAALHRGDRGVRLELGGRRDDAILSAGATIVPADVEACFGDAPGIAEIAVVGVPARRVGHEVGALLVPTAAEHARAAHDPADWIRHRFTAVPLPRSHRPRLALVVDELPRTATGKLDRAAARRLLERSDAIRVGWHDGADDERSDHDD